MHDVRRARLVVLGGLVSAGLASAACGGSSGSSAGANTTVPAAATPTTAAGDSLGAGLGAALTAFRTCMSSHGITVSLPTGRRNRTGIPPSTTPGDTRPAPGGGGPGGGGFGGGFANRFATAPAGVDTAKYATAYAACKSKLPTGDGNGALQNNSAFKAYVSCLLDHGVTLPSTPTTVAGGTTPPTATGATATTPTTFDRNDPKVQAAMQTCRPLLPARGTGATTTTTAPPA